MIGKGKQNRKTEKKTVNDLFTRLFLYNLRVSYNVSLCRQREGGGGGGGGMTVYRHALISAHLVGGHWLIDTHHTFRNIEIRLILDNVGRGVIVIVSAPVAERERVEML